VVWVRSSLLALRREQVRREHLARATQDLEALAARLAQPRSRLRARHEIMDHVQKVLAKYHVRGYLTVQLAQAEEHRFHQAGPGRTADVSADSNLVPGSPTVEEGHGTGPETGERDLLAWSYGALEGHLSRAQPVPHGLGALFRLRYRLPPFRRVDLHVADRARHLLRRRHRLPRETARFDYVHVHSRMGVVEVRNFLKSHACE